MTDREELLKRINGFMDELSDEAKSSFGEDVDGIIDYASVGSFERVATMPSGPSIWEVESRFSEKLKRALVGEFDNILVNSDWVIPGLLPVDKTRIELFSAWVDRNYVDDIREMAEASDEPVDYSDAMLADCVYKIVMPLVPAEAGSKAEMRFAGNLPAGLSIENLRTILTILPYASQLRLAMANLPEADENLVLDDASYNSVTMFMLQTVQTITSDIVLRWFVSALPARLNAPECLVNAAVGIKARGNNEPLYELLINTALDIFDHEINEIEAGADDLTTSLQRRLRRCAVLGRALFVYADLSANDDWVERSNQARGRLFKRMETRLNKCQPIISDFLLCADASQLVRTDDGMADQALLAMAEYCAISELPQVFAMAGLVQQYSKRYAKMFEVGLERMLEHVRQSSEMNRVHIIARYDTAIQMAEHFFNDEYPQLMRNRLSNELLNL